MLPVTSPWPPPSPFHSIFVSTDTCSDITDSAQTTHKKFHQEMQFWSVRNEHTLQLTLRSIRTQSANESASDPYAECVRLCLLLLFSGEHLRCEHVLFPCVRVCACLRLALSRHTAPLRCCSTPAVVSPPLIPTPVPSLGYWPAGCAPSLSGVNWKPRDWLRRWAAPLAGWLWVVWPGVHRTSHAWEINRWRHSHE